MLGGKRVAATLLFHSPGVEFAVQSDASKRGGSPRQLIYIFPMCDLSGRGINAAIAQTPISDADRMASPHSAYFYLPWVSHPNYTVNLPFCHVNNNVMTPLATNYALVEQVMKREGIAVDSYIFQINNVA